MYRKKIGLALMAGVLVTSPLLGGSMGGLRSGSSSTPPKLQQPQGNFDATTLSPNKNTGPLGQKKNVNKNAPAAPKFDFSKTNGKLQLNGSQNSEPPRTFGGAAAGSSH